MATLYGGAMPDDFVSGEELTATEFNKVKNYWIVDGDLPEGPEILDGDVVFVLGDSAVGAADITAITGSGVTHTYGDFVAFEFMTSGSLTCTEGTVEYLIVAGGGGSAPSNQQSGGSGGAGGLLSGVTPIISGTSTVTVGAGGAISTQGDNSVFGSLTAIGGGAGFYSADGGDGGSGGGGGGGYGTSGSTSGGAGTAGQGHAGGIGYKQNGIPVSSAGGGGAYEVGGDSGYATGGSGGSGVTSNITGDYVFYAGGGGGGARNGTPGIGGAGGGGNGITNGVAANPGTPNTGGGAGGTGSNNAGSVSSPGAIGGSGVVIIKVLASNASNVDKSGWTEVTALMLAKAQKKRELERKAQEAARVLEAKNKELSGATQMDIEGDLI